MSEGREREVREMEGSEEISRREVRERDKQGRGDGMAGSESGYRGVLVRVRTGGER